MSIMEMLNVKVEHGNVSYQVFVKVEMILDDKICEIKLDEDSWYCKPC